MNAPCFKCQNRSPTCHASCNDYISFKKEIESKKDPFDVLLRDDFNRSLERAKKLAIKYHRGDNKFH